MAVVDSFEAMTATQYYREAEELGATRSTRSRSSRQALRPEIVEAFKKALPRCRRCARPSPMRSAT